MADIRLATDPNFWAERLKTARANGEADHVAVYCVSVETWAKVQELTARALEPYIKPKMMVLDAGCGLGHLCELLPEDVRYVGIDLCPEFIAAANKKYCDHRRSFFTWDLRDPLPLSDGAFDLVVARSIEGTVGSNLPPGSWGPIWEELRRVGRKVLYIEYNDPLLQKGKADLYVRLVEGISCGST